MAREKGERKEVREMGEKQRREMEKPGGGHSTTVNLHEKRKRDTGHEEKVEKKMDRRKDGTPNI